MRDECTLLACPENDGNEDHVNGHIDLVVVMRAVQHELLLQAKDVSKRHRLLRKTRVGGERREREKITGSIRVNLGYIRLFFTRT